ncbi:Smr/MutS family protein [Paragemmobacter straminiformis]|uniref:Smr/MutS family protein n=1 Tax=Paragemmobacter straminiformis TaxID=2045119 RepID=A0A842I858_9RHOB|nr:Smr/MutS family protein [Gemmobacter straminiformis]MBC2836030.1 Smr/MutS family protein [Gemmobacter straminiformis]
MARRRHLRPDEEDLWHAVARTAKPMHAPTMQRRIETQPAPPAPEPPKHHTPMFEPFRLGEKAKPRTGHNLAPSIAESLSQAPVQMDAKAFGKMTRGKLAPEARIDLHGMTLAEAHPELIRFILNAQSDGLRLVLVITGKGKRRDDTGPIPQRMGALRHQVPQWLRMAPLGPAVLQVAEAHLKHGGSGAYYVYLRRR